MKRLSFAVLGRRLRHEHGFSLIEVVVAMGVIFFSMLMLVTTSIIGFNGAQVAKHRQTATALADKIVEQVRALPFTAVTEGLLDSDLSGDSNIVTGGGCGTAYKYQSCTIDSSNPPIGETIVHQASLTYSSGTPLYPHKVTLGSSAGFPQGGTQAVYITRVNGSTTVYRLTVVISWTLGARTQSIQTSTQLSNPTGSGGSSNNASTSTAYFYGSGTLSPGSVVVSPNASVYQGVGVSGITSGTWNTGDAMTQRLLSMDAEVTQGQLSVTSGQATTTSVEKSISGTVTSAGGTSTYSSADDDPNSSVGTSSNPTAISQPGSAVSMSLTGSGNSLGMNQYTQTATTTTQTTTTTNTVTMRSDSNANSGSASIAITNPAGMAAGDYLVAHLAYQTTTTSTCMTTPSGWTLIRCDVNGSNPRQWSAVYGKFATAADVSAGSLSFTTNATSGVVGGIVAYSSVDPTTPVFFSNSNTGNSSSASTAVVASSIAKDSQLLALYSARGDTTITTGAPASDVTNWAQLWSDTGGASPNYYLTSTPALSTTAGSGTLSSGTTSSSTFALAKSFPVTVDTQFNNATSTSWGIQVSVSAVTGPYEYYFKLVRQNSAGVAQSTSGNSTTWTDTGTKTFTFTWDPGTWSTGDKLVVEMWHRRPSGSGNKSATINTTSASFVAPPPFPDVRVGGAASAGKKSQGASGFPGWPATLSQSTLWVAQMLVLNPSSTTTTTTSTSTSTGAPGTESGSTVSAVAASASPACGTPSQTDGRPCAYATQAYAVPAGVDNAFLSTIVDFSGSTNGYTGLGTCRLYAYNPPNASVTNYAYGRRQATTGDGKVRQDVKRYYGTHTFGSLCSGTGAPSNWPGYFVKYDAGTSGCEVIADAGVSAGTPSTTTCGTISVWNGSGVTSFAPPSSGAWSTSPTTVSFTSGSYKYDISAVLASGPTSTSSTGSNPITVAKAIIGAPVLGTIAYKLTDVTNSRVLIDVTLTIDLGTMTASTTYTPAA